MFGNLTKKFAGAALSPFQGVQKMAQGNFREGMGDMLFGPDAYYGNYWKKQFGMAPPPEDIITPEGGPQVGYGDYSGDLGSSNPYGALRARGGR